ncbi:MAG: SufB/SufD family protein [Paracoccaceae bacterium]
MVRVLGKDPARGALTEARIGKLDAPPAGFTAGARAEALARLRAAGLPSRRDDYWRYTDPAGLVAEAAGRLAGSGGGDGELAAIGAGVTVGFTDGVFDAARSDALVLAGAEVERLAAVTADIHWARGLYGALEAAGQDPVPRPLATLNTAAAADGVLVRVTGRAARPLRLSYASAGGASDAVLHHVVRLEPGAELTLIETGTGGARVNTVLEVEVGAGARFHHVRAQGSDPDRQVATHVFAKIGAGAVFKSFTAALNGRLTRNEAVLDIAGDGAVAHVAGVALGDAAAGPFHHDDTVFVTHGAVGCKSRQVFKKVLRHGATGVFQGKILVKKGAQKTDGYQISQALLLDEDSQFLAKPELEIYADDVKCSHGSTTGAIDETALFYLRSRGVGREEAVRLLVLSFLADAIGEIEDEALRDEVAAGLEAWMTGHRG